MDACPARLRTYANPPTRPHTQKMIDVFDTQGAKEASQTPIASGMLPCLSDSQVDEVLQPTLQFGNTAVYIHQFAQVTTRKACPRLPPMLARTHQTAPCDRLRCSAQLPVVDEPLQ